MGLDNHTQISATTPGNVWIRRVVGLRVTAPNMNDGLFPEEDFANHECEMDEGGDRNQNITLELLPYKIENG